MLDIIDSLALGKMTHSDFCILPRGDDPSPGRRLVDAVAAGCVPMIIGDHIILPLGKLLPYESFTVRVSESEFVRYPKTTIEEALAKAVPQLASLRRSLMHARGETAPHVHAPVDFVACVWV